MIQLFVVKFCMLIILLGITTISYGNNQESSLSKSASEDWLALSDSMQKRIVRDYVNALDSFAQAMPIVGGDTESTWAADTVHVMAKRVKEGKRSFLESMNDIYQMQNYIAYGMSYRIAMIGLALDTSKLCNYVLSNMLASSDSLNQAIIADDYKSVKTWNVIRFESILNMQLFYALNGMNCQPQYEDKGS